MLEDKPKADAPKPPPAPKPKTLDEQIAELDPNDTWKKWDEGTKKGYLIALQNTKRITEGKS